MIDINTFDIGRFFIASVIGVIMMVGMVLLLNTKQDSKYNYLGIFFLFFSMGGFIATGTISDIFLIGIENNDKTADMLIVERFTVFFGVFVMFVSSFPLFKFFNCSNQKA